MVAVAVAVATHNPPSNYIPSHPTLLAIRFAHRSLVAAHMKSFTATVGKKPSAASSFINDVDEVTELLNALTKVSARELKNTSPGLTYPGLGGVWVAGVGWEVMAGLG